VLRDARRREIKQTTERVRKEFSKSLSVWENLSLKKDEK